MSDYDWSAYDAAYEWEPREDEFCPACGLRECDCITECGHPPRSHNCKCIEVREDGKRGRVR